MGRAVLRLVEEGPAAVAARFEALPAAVEHRGHGDADELAAEAVDAVGFGLEPRGAARRRRRTAAPRARRRVSTASAAASRFRSRFAASRARNASRSSSACRRSRSVNRVPRGRGRARRAQASSARGIAEPLALVLEVDGVDERLHEPERLRRGLRYVVAGSLRHLQKYFTGVQGAHHHVVAPPGRPDPARIPARDGRVRRRSSSPRPASRWPRARSPRSLPRASSSRTARSAARSRPCRPISAPCSVTWVGVSTIPADSCCGARQAGARGHRSRWARSRRPRCCSTATRGSASRSSASARSTGSAGRRSSAPGRLPRSRACPGRCEVVAIGKSGFGAPGFTVTGHGSLRSDPVASFFQGVAQGGRLRLAAGVDGLTRTADARRLVPHLRLGRAARAARRQGLGRRRLPGPDRPREHRARGELSQLLADRADGRARGCGREVADRRPAAPARRRPGGRPAARVRPPRGHAAPARRPRERATARLVRRDRLRRRGSPRWPRPRSSSCPRRCSAGCSEPSPRWRSPKRRTRPAGAVVSRSVASCDRGRADARRRRPRNARPLPRLPRAGGRDRRVDDLDRRRRRRGRARGGARRLRRRRNGRAVARLERGHRDRAHAASGTDRARRRGRDRARAATGAPRVRAGGSRALALAQARAPLARARSRDGHGRDRLRQRQRRARGLRGRVPLDADPERLGSRRVRGSARLHGQAGPEVRLGRDAGRLRVRGALRRGSGRSGSRERRRRSTAAR